MTKLYVFNPEHDLALASNLANFTAPHAGRQLRADLCYLPALWAGPDDYVLVEHVELARRLYGRLRARVGGAPGHFVDKSQLSHIIINKVEPWGWNLALRSGLIRYGVNADACASEAEIAIIRECSHRRHTAEVLRRLDWESPIEAMTVETVEQRLSLSPRLVVKAPWSSSGRGVRFIDGELTDNHRGWISHIIQQQGSVMVEPYYPKVKDFAMEFEALPDSRICYLGLSLFDTRNGAYTGNIIASEEDKLETISRYVSEGLIDSVREKVMGALCEVIGRQYTGPFGVDMMIVAKPDGNGFLIHPCVEINLRRTMGHVALTMARTSSASLPRVMQITLTDKYRIHILRKR